ncbi:MAG: hypothetical protein ABI456_17510 [Ktedonobacteraceae bacterium]
MGSISWNKIEGCEHLLLSIAHISPVAWQHLNFYGRYEFTKASDFINMEEIIEALARHPIISMWMKELPS